MRLAPLSFFGSAQSYYILVRSRKSATNVLHAREQEKPLAQKESEF
jgi:hypothetical protein